MSKRKGSSDNSDVKMTIGKPVDADDGQEIERYKAIIDHLLRTNRKRVVLFELLSSEPGKFRMVVTAPPMNEKEIAELIAAQMDFMKSCLMAYGDADQIIASVSTAMKNMEGQGGE